MSISLPIKNVASKRTDMPYSFGTVTVKRRDKGMFNSFMSYVVISMGVRGEEDLKSNLEQFFSAIGVVKYHG